MTEYKFEINNPPEDFLVITLYKSDGDEYFPLMTKTWGCTAVHSRRDYTDTSFIDVSEEFADAVCEALEYAKNSGMPSAWRMVVPEKLATQERWVIGILVELTLGDNLSDETEALIEWCQDVADQDGGRE